MKRQQSDRTRKIQARSLKKKQSSLLKKSAVNAAKYQEGYKIRELEKLFSKCFVIRLPSEVNPFGDGRSIDTYVGLGGRALHHMQALLFADHRAAEEISTRFEGSSIEEYTLPDWNEGIPDELEAIYPDPEVRATFIREVEEEIGGDLREEEAIKRITIPDDRAPNMETPRMRTPTTVFRMTPVRLTHS